MFGFHELLIVFLILIFLFGAAKLPIRTKIVTRLGAAEA